MLVSARLGNKLEPVEGQAGRAWRRHAAPAEDDPFMWHMHTAVLLQLDWWL